MSPKEHVDKLLRKYNTNNPFELADFLNVIVLKRPLGNIKVFYKLVKRNKVIFLNNTLKDMESIVVCSHELGHAVMHPTTNCRFIQNYTLFLTDKIEIEANTFCSNLILTDELIEEYQSFTYEQIAASTQIPVEIVKLRKL